MFTQTAINHHSYANRFGLPRWLPKTQQLVWLVGALGELAHEQQAEPEPTSDVKPATRRQEAAIKASRKHTANRRQRTHARTEMRTAMSTWWPGQEEDEQAKVEAEAEYWQWETSGMETWGSQAHWDWWRFGQKVLDIDDAWEDARRERRDICRITPADNQPQWLVQQEFDEAQRRMDDFDEFAHNEWRIEGDSSAEAYFDCQHHAIVEAHRSLAREMQWNVLEGYGQGHYRDFIVYEKDDEGWQAWLKAREEAFTCYF